MQTLRLRLSRTCGTWVEPWDRQKKQKKKKKTNKTQKYDCKSESNVVSLAIPGMPKLFEQKSEKLK